MSQKFFYSTSIFIGETTHGLPLPVFFDPHASIVNNNPPGTLITGAPGSGKTFFALTLTAISTILGKTTIVLDPKGDFLALSNIREEIGRFSVWDLSRGKAGLLDPFYMASDPSDVLALVIDTIGLFVGGISGDDLHVLSPIVKDVQREPNPSLQKVVDKLRASTKTQARNLGTQLDLIRRMKFAKLCFAPGNTKRPTVVIDKGLTVITLVGLDLPKGDGAKTRQQQLASGIIFLLTDYLRRIMMNEESKNPKTLVIDEAHIVLASDVGARTIKEIALLGRSKYLALVLITQNNSHLKNLDIENTISTRFAFHSDRREAASIVEDMELPKGEAFEDIVVNLEVGECLMKDFLKRYSTVKISSYKQDWREAFETNPLVKQQRKRAAEEAKRAAEQAELERNAL